MGRHRVAREGRLVEQQHPVALAGQQHRGRRPRAARSDDDRVVPAVAHVAPPGRSGGRSHDPAAVARRGRPSGRALPPELSRPAPELVIRSRGGPPCQSRHIAVASSLSSPSGRLEDGLDEVLHRFARMHLRARRDHGLDVDAGGVALEHAVGEEHQPVTGLERQRLHAVLVAAARSRTAGRPRSATRLDAAVAQPQRRRMPGVDDRRRLGAQVDPRDLAGHEAALRRVVARARRWPGAPARRARRRPGARCAAPPTSTVASTRGADLVAHGVGHREVQRVALQREVERVAADVAGGLQPGRERELPGLARVGAGQQAVLDLGGQRQRHRALAPLEEVGEPAVGDDDVGERVRGERDVGQRLLVRGARPRRSSSTPMASPRLVTGANTRVPPAPCSTTTRLPGERAPVRAVPPAARARRSRAPCVRAAALAAGVAEPDQRLAAEVGDEERHLVRAERLGQARRQDVGRGDRRRVLDRREQLRQVQRGMGVARRGGRAGSVRRGRSPARSGVLLDIAPSSVLPPPSDGLSRSEEEGDG